MCGNQCGCPSGQTCMNGACTGSPPPPPPQCSPPRPRQCGTNCCRNNEQCGPNNECVDGQGA
jgi:hypothetical protein